MEDQLHRTDHAAAVFRDEQRAFAVRHSISHSPPKLQRLRPRQWVHETHRSAAIHAIDQDVGKPLHMSIGNGGRTLHDEAVGSVAVRLIPYIHAGRSSQNCKTSLRHFATPKNAVSHGKCDQSWSPYNSA